MDYHELPGPNDDVTGQKLVVSTTDDNATFTVSSANSVASRYLSQIHNPPDYYGHRTSNDIVYQLVLFA